MPLRLLLIGVGHSHLEVLRRSIATPLPNVNLTALSLGPRHHYSGMVPGYLAGAYTEDEISVDVPHLVTAAGGQFIAGRATSLDPHRQTVHLADGRELPYDLVSFAVGSDSAGAENPRIAAHIQRIKPLEQVVNLHQRLLDLAPQSRLVIVGGGAAGVEVALALNAILAAAPHRSGGFRESWGRAEADRSPSPEPPSVQQAATRTRRVTAPTHSTPKARSFEAPVPGPPGPAAAPPRITILDAGDRELPTYSDRFRRRARRLLARRGIAVRTSSQVAAVSAAEVELENGDRLPADLTVWLTGAVAWPLFRASGLPIDDRGFLLVDDSLRSLADPKVFAAGDCATLASHPETPKAGVYAVRQGPILWESLRAALTGAAPPRYEPQQGFLSILSTADGRALLSYKGLVSHSRWAWKLKDAIDRRFMARYQKL